MVRIVIRCRIRRRSNAAAALSRTNLIQSGHQEGEIVSNQESSSHRRGRLSINGGPWAFQPHICPKQTHRGNAAATAHKILTHETLFRLSIVGDLLGQVIFICLAITLYRLLSDVNKTWARLMVGFVLVSAAVGLLNALNNIAALMLFQGADFLAVIARPQRDALAMLFVRLHTQGHFINEIFWGLWLFPFGLLVFRSGFLPRFLGIWLMLACSGWLALSLIALLIPPYYNAAFRIEQPVMFGELAIMLLASDQRRQGANRGGRSQLNEIINMNTNATSERTVEMSPLFKARTAGVLYLILIVAAGFMEFFVRDRLVFSGDAVATATNILAHEWLWRSGQALCSSTSHAIPAWR